MTAAIAINNIAGERHVIVFSDFIRLDTKLWNLRTASILLMHQEIYVEGVTCLTFCGIIGEQNHGFSL